MPHWKRVTIIGVGLIGGSIGLALRRRGLAESVVGFGSRQATLDVALEMGALDKTEPSLERAASGAQLVVACSPVQYIPTHLLSAAEHCREDALLTDVGCTKQEIVHALQSLPPRVRFCGSHPLAGSEKSGPRHADERLFDGRTVVLTPTTTTDPRTLEELTLFWSQLGAKVVTREPADHDRALASTSHLPHVVASALAAATSDADLRNFDYPADSLAKFQGMVTHDATGQLIPTGPGTFARLPGTSYRLQNLDNGGTSSLGQSPLRAPSVFNWFLPGYKPGGLIASYGKAAPEFQIVTESSVLQNINLYWQSHYNGNGLSGQTVGGNNTNSALAGYGTQRQYSNGSTTYTDDNIIPDHYAWINRYKSYQVDPENPMNDEQEIDLQLINDLDDLLLAGRFKLLYPVDPGDDGTSVRQGSLTHHPGRNPRETLLHYLSDTWSSNDDW